MSQIRLQFDPGKQSGEFLIDAQTRVAPEFIQGQAYSVDIGLFNSDEGRDLADYDSIVFGIYYGNGTELFTVTITAPWDSSKLRLTHWNLGVEKNISFEIADDDLDYSFPDDTAYLEIYVVVSGSGDYDEDVLGRGRARLYKQIPAGSAPLPYQESPYVRKRDYVANSILAATTNAEPEPVAIGAATIVGRQTGGAIGSIARVSSGEIAAGTETQLRAFAPADVAAAGIAAAATRVEKATYTAHSILAATTEATPTARTISPNCLAGRQGSGEIAGIGKVSAPEIGAGTETGLRGFSPADVKNMIDTHGSGVSIDEEATLGRQSGGEVASIPRISTVERTAGTGSALRSFAPIDIKTMAEAFGGASSPATSVYDETWISAGYFIPWETYGADLASLTMPVNGGVLGVREFVSGQINGCCCAFSFPDGWDLTGFKAKIHWCALEGAGNAVWSVRARFARNADYLDAAYGTEQTVVSTALAAYDGDVIETITSATVLVVPSGTPNAHGLVTIEVRRKGTDVLDTFDATALFIGLKIQFYKAPSGSW